MTLDFEQIKELIPQRFPFIMIDKVLEIEPGKHAIAVKNVSGNDVFIPGHFPEKAIMPGALIIEAMAQTAIILFAYTEEQKKDRNNLPSSPANPALPMGTDFKSVPKKGGVGGFFKGGKEGDLEKGGQGGASDKKPLYYFGSVKARFLYPVVPGDQIKIKVVNVKSLPTNAYVSAEAFVDDKLIAEAELVFSVKDEGLK